MRQILMLLGFISSAAVQAQNLDRTMILRLEEQLGDVMEIIDNELLIEKLQLVEASYQKHANELNKARLGIIYHEVALNLSFFDKTKKYAGYAQKSYDLLTELSEDANITPELLIFVMAYRASALSLISGETGKLKFLNQAFELFEEAIAKYGHLSPRPAFMRGSVAENLPWFLWKKRKYAKKDFGTIIEKAEKDHEYAEDRLLSFTYWGWANAHQSKKYRKQALEYLNLAIEIDPNYRAGRKRAEALKKELLKK